VPGHAAQVWSAGAAVHAVPAAVPAAPAAPGRRQQTPVQKGADRVPKAQGVRARQLRAA